MSAVVILALLLIIGGLLCQLPGLDPNEPCDCPECDAIAAEVDAALLEGYRGPGHDPSGDPWPVLEGCQCPRCIEAQGPRPEAQDTKADFIEWRTAWRAAGRPEAPWPDAG